MFGLGKNVFSEKVFHRLLRFAAMSWTSCQRSALA